MLELLQSPGIAGKVQKLLVVLSSENSNGAKHSLEGNLISLTSSRLVTAPINSTIEIHPGVMKSVMYQLF
jgi:hypothetical protein